ncbi:MAG: gamma-glutamylcyclotransferase [Roseomonas mucosa]|nr:gamma-glutamylcyclotransferase [Roseomonas mucosa]
MSLTDPSSLAAPDEDIPLSDVLTRDLLRSGKLDRMVAAAVPGLRLMSDAEREASLRQTLAARPAAEEGAWVFAYGSLMWNPTIHHVDRRVARVEGWHRSFCLSTPIGRGTPENPGLVLALDEGGCYRPVWVPLHDSRGEVFGQGIAFAIDPAGPQCVRLGEAETVRRLATARGQIGSSADYLFRTREGLEALGLSDPAIERLAALVAGFGAAA